MADATSSIQQLLRQELPRLYAFAYHMCCSRDEALVSVKQLVADVRAQGEAKFLGADKPSDALLGLMARSLEESLGRKSEYTFEGLDEILRSDITRPIDLTGGPLGGDPVKQPVQFVCGGRRIGQPASFVHHGAPLLCGLESDDGLARNGFDRGIAIAELQREI